MEETFEARIRNLLIPIANIVELVKKDYIFKVPQEELYELSDIIQKNIQKLIDIGAEMNSVNNL